MPRYQSLSEVWADDVLADWRRYCQARGMTFGGYPAPDAHTFAVTSEDHRLCVTIGRPEGAAPADTLDAFLTAYLRTHPHLRLTTHPTEQEMLEMTKYEGCIGFIVP